MSVIVIVSDSSTSDREFASSLADRLGYRCVLPEVVIERAAARGVSHRELSEALETAPGILRRYLHAPRIHLTLLRAALAEEIRPGNAVCYGNLGLLLPEMEGLLWIRADYSHQTRCAHLRERLKLTPPEAAAWVREQESDRRKWRRWACGPDYDERLRGALPVGLEPAGVDSACDAAAHIVRAMEEAAGAPERLAALENLTLSSRVKAALARDPATSHLELEARAESGSVWVHGWLRSVDELEDVRRVIGEVDGVAAFNLDRVSLSGDELLPPPRVRTARRIGDARAPGRTKPCLAWAAMAAVMVFVISYSVAVSKVSSKLSSFFYRPATGMIQTFTGIITDTKCAGSHATMPEPARAECARRCVRTDPGVRFALHDGKTLYVLADQSDGDKFAGRRVAIIGSVDAQTKALKARSVKSL